MFHSTVQNNTLTYTKVSITDVLRHVLLSVNRQEEQTNIARHTDNRNQEKRKETIDWETSF